MFVIGPVYYVMFSAGLDQKAADLLTMFEQGK